ncbi:MAG: aminomethyltransferase family protein [Acidimicrobiales bacterium]
MDTESTRSPFYEVAAAAGASFMEEAGWFWTEGFGDPDGEYRGVRDDLGVWDVSPLNKWEFRGPDALAAAQRVHSNNILGLSVGQVRYGALCDAAGLMLDDGTVYRLDDRVWLMTNGSERAEHFAEATDGLDVEIEAVTRAMPHLGLQGPRSREALGPLCEADISGLGYFRFLPEPTKVGGVPCVVSRTGFGGELGYELFCRPEDATDLWEVVVTEMDARPFGVGVLESLRVEAGLIVLDYDYSAGERTPYDLSLDRMVALGTVDFLGSDALKAVAESPPRRLKTLRLDSDELPKYGAEVTRDGEPVGTLTSPAISPRYGPIALAILEVEVARSGERVEVGLESGAMGATVAELAIYDPEKRRPRA